jgi:hypothetical protein
MGSVWRSWCGDAESGWIDWGKSHFWNWNCKLHKWRSINHGIGWLACAVEHWTADWRLINHEDIGRAIIEAVPIIKIHLHTKETIVTVKVKLAWTTVLETILHPQDRDMA